MADGALLIELPETLEERLKSAAEASGVSEADFVRSVLEQQLADLGGYDFGDVDLDPSIDEAIADEVEQNGSELSFDQFEKRMAKFGQRK